MKIVAPLFLLIGVIAALMIYQSAPPKQITAQITVISGCEIAVDDFAIQNQLTKTAHRLSRGKVTLNLTEGTPLKVILSRKYDGIEFFGPEFKAKPQQIITAYCGDDARSRNVLGTMRKQFSD